MSVTGLVLLLNSEGYNTGDLKIYYDFTDKSGAYVLSDPYITQTYSGKIESYGTGASNEINYSRVENSGYHFFGGVKSPAGDYNANRIAIQNANALTSEEFTFLIVGGLRKPADFADATGSYTGSWNTNQNHAFDSYPIFSNREAGLYCADGIEIGLTNTNRLYFECIDPEKFQPFSLSTTSVGSRDNIWFVRYDGTRVDLGRYNLFEEAFDKNTEQLNNLSMGDAWYIGSGINTLNNLIGTSTVSGNSFMGNLRRFVYISTALDDPTLNSAAQIIYGELATGANEYDSVGGFATGITGSGITLLTGITGYSGTLVDTSAFSGENFEYFTVLTGTINSGSYYYTEYSLITGTGVDYATGFDAVYQRVENTGASITGITGFTILTGTQNLDTGVWDYFNLTALTGVIGSGIEYYYGSGTGTFFASSGENALSSLIPSFLRPYSRSYLGQRYSTGDFVEHIYGIEQTGDFIINKNAAIDDSHYFPGTTPFFYESNTQANTNLFINGVARWASGITVNTEESLVIEYVSGDQYIVRDCNGGRIVDKTGLYESIRQVKEQTYSISGDWYLTGTEVMESLPFIGEDAISLSSTYDRNQTGIRIIYSIPATGHHTGIRSTNIPEFFTDLLFFNGQKLVSGEHFTGHYNGSYTEFGPCGWILEETGAYFTFPSYTGQSTTGLQNYDLYTGYFAPKSVVSFINGIRVIDELFIEHDSRADLITGIEAFIDNLTEVFTNGN